jgi:uncharacterized membrane protein YsdA (DUF1294 family)
MPPDKRVAANYLISPCFIAILYGLVSLGVAFALDYIFWTRLFMDPLLSWLIAISGIAFLTYTFDRAVVRSAAWRVPLELFYIHFIIGGTIGAWLGMRVYRHQAALQAFKRWGVVIIPFQVILIFIYVWLLL